MLSYFMICSPGGMRINSGPIRTQVEAVARQLDEQECFPQPPQALGNKTLENMLDDGTVEIQIDPQYAGAIGISDILSRVSLFGNSCWDIITNLNEGCEFFTSDYPVAIEPTPDPRILSRFLPLTPNIAVRAIPDLAYSRSDMDLNFPGFRYRKFEIDAAESRRLNLLLVRCAEDLVLASDWRGWRPRFIEKHRHYRLDTQTNVLTVNHGEVMHFRTGIVRHNQS